MSIDSGPLYLITLVSIPGPVWVSREVFDAIRSQSGVVALESTIITHGMPYPHNLQ